MGDSYISIKNPAEGLYKEKGSRFLAFAREVSDEQQAKKLIADFAKEYHDARHICYAYRIGFDGKIMRSSDAGEPSNTAGKPILNQLITRNLTNTLVVVVRYFGGTLLGVAGLIQAYKNAASEALQNAGEKINYVTCPCLFYFNYDVVDKVMSLIKKYQAKIEFQQFEKECTIKILVRIGLLQQLLAEAKRIDGLRVTE